MDKELQTIAILTILHYISVKDIGNFVHCGLNFPSAGTKSVFLYYKHRVFVIVYGKFDLHL